MRIKSYCFAYLIVCIYNLFCMEHQKYDYLKSAPFKERMKIAAAWVQECSPIVEIGGAGNPMSKYLKNTKVIVIDPEISRKDDEMAVHIRADFEHWKGQAELENTKYAVIIMALDLNMQCRGWNKLCDLIDGSSKTVIEYSSEYKRAKKQLKDIEKNVLKKRTLVEEFDFSDYNFGKYRSVYPYRTMICLE